MVSVRKRGKVYEYRIEIASIDGTRKWLTKSGFKTRQEALHEGSLAYNEYYYYGKKNKNRDMSFADYLDYWIDNYCNFHLKYATIVTYLNIIKVHLKPKLGMYKLSQIDSELIQNFINQLYVEHSYSKCYLKGILKAMKGALKYACYDVNFINHNPAEHVHIPRYEVVTGDPAHIYTQEEIERILDRFKDLPWDNIDFENKTLTVDKNIIRKNKDGLPKRYNIAKGHSTETWFYGSCKNPQSRRTIAIGDTLIKALKEYKKLTEEHKKFYGDKYLKHYEKKVLNENTKREEIKIVDAEAELDVSLPEARLIFVKPNGQFRGTETPRHAYKVINYELKIPSRFHDFRDTHATRLIEQGADIKAVSKRLGHSTIMTTYNIYVRVTEKMETDTVDRFESYTNSLDIPDNEEILYKD